MPVHPLPPGPWIRHVLYFQGEQRVFSNDFWFLITGTIPTDLDINTVAAAINNILAPACLNVMNSGVSFIGSKTYLNNGTYTQSATALASTPGMGSDGPIPIEVAAIVALDADIATRAGQGRLFIGGLDASSVTGNRPSTDGAANLLNLAEAYHGMNTIAGVSTYPSIWSRKIGGLHGIVSYSVSSLLGTRRKRRPRF